MERARFWSMTEAKANFREMIDMALVDGPQTITRNGRPAVIVVSLEEWERASPRRRTLAEFLANSPLRGADITIERMRDEPRDINL